MRITFLAILIMIVLRAWTPASAQNNIVVNGADAMRTDSVTGATRLNSVLGGVQVRIGVQAANTRRDIHLANFAPALAHQLDLLLPRVALQFANTKRLIGLNPPSSQLDTVLANVTPRITLQYANGNRLMPLTYPRELLNDQTRPVISPPASAVEGGNVRLIWASDEFARCTLRYGTQSGIYTDAREEALFAMQHEQLLPAPSAGVYFVQISCTDQSDNISVGPEFKLATSSALFLPLIQK